MMHLRKSTITVAALVSLTAPGSASGEILNFDYELAGAPLSAANLTGKWAPEGEQCDFKAIEAAIQESGESGGCIRAVMHTNDYDRSQHLISEVCFPEAPDYFGPGSFKVVQEIDQDTLGIKEGTEWIREGGSQVG